MTAVPRIRSRRGDVVAVVTVLAVWLVPWFALTAAATVSGARPDVSPLAFIDPVRLVATYRADGNVLVPWHLVGAPTPAHMWVFFAALAVAAVLLATVGVAAVVMWSGQGGPFGTFGSPSRSVRTGRWATWGDLRPLRVRRRRPGTFVLGRRGQWLIATEPETSVLVVGPTRSGKTSSLVVPNLLEWDGPAIVTSTKSELVDITAAHRARRGPVAVYDPTGEAGEQRWSATWSPLAGCATLDGAWRLAAWMCAALQQPGTRGDNDWAHWAESGKLLVAPLLYAAATGGRPITDVRDWILDFDLDAPAALLHELGAAGMDADTDAARALRMLTSIDQRPEKERGTVFSTVMRMFNVFSERAVAQSARKSTFDPDSFLTGGGTLYLCTPRQSPERIASLFVGLLMTVVTRAYARADRAPHGQLQPALGLFLDELANVVPVEDLPSLASQGAGRGVLLMSIVQDLSQLRSRYGADRSNSILNNHTCKVVLPGVSDPETTDLLARLIGRAEYTDVQVTSGGRSPSRAYSLRRDQMLGPDALRQLPPGTAVVLDRGRPPALVRLRPWHAQRRLRRLTRRATAP